MKTKKNEESKMKFLKHPITIGIISLGGLYGLLFLSKYFIKASSDALKACKEFNSVLKY